MAFYSFGLILLPTLAFVGLATFHRVLQTGTEDLAYARRIARLRGYYFDHAPELAGYLLDPAEALPTPGLGIGLWQQFVTGRRRGRRRWGADRADAVSEFGLDPGQHRVAPFSCRYVLTRLNAAMSRS